MKIPKVAIIICTYNQEVLLRKCLNSVRSKTNYKNYKVYFVDDSGKGKIGKNISEKYRWINVIINRKNKGFSGANNVGIKKALKGYSPDYVLLLNDDTEVLDKNWLKKMVETGEKNDDAGIMGCKIVYPDGSLQNIGGYLRKWELVKELDEGKKAPFEVDHVMGAFMMIKKSVIGQIGLLDEAYSPYLLEDTDYCLRAKREGYKVISVPEVKTIHKKGKTLKTLESSKKMFIRLKNDIYFSKKNLGILNKSFRIFIYLPFVAIFKKRKDEASLNPLNFSLRKEFLRNIFLYFKALLNI